MRSKSCDLNKPINVKNIDTLNIALIIISLIVAIRLPFKLFLFSYAVLGPLHYLTEINWLRERNYFVKTKRNWVWLFAIFAIVMSIGPTIDYLDLGLGEALKSISKRIVDQRSLILLVSFFFSVGLIFFSRTEHLIYSFISALILAFVLIVYLPLPVIFATVFLPTLFHVYLFTLFFILYGALKAKSKHGLYLSLCLLLVPVAISYFPFHFFNANPSQSSLDVFATSEMNYVSMLVAALFDGLQEGQFVQLSEVGIRIQAFIAFAYTYHYLNWFSKTSIIGWRKAITKNKAYLILFIWLLSVGIYLYDFETGFVALFFLSFLHVLLEFPLNVTSLNGIAIAMKERLVKS